MNKTDLSEIYRSAVDLSGADCLVNPDEVVTLVDSGIDHPQLGLLHILICKQANFVVNEQTALKIAKALEAKYAHIGT